MSPRTAKAEKKVKKRCHRRRKRNMRTPKQHPTTDILNAAAVMYRLSLASFVTEHDCSSRSLDQAASSQWKDCKKGCKTPHPDQDVLDVHAAADLLVRVHVRVSSGHIATTYKYHEQEDIPKEQQYDSLHVLEDLKKRHKTLNRLETKLKAENSRLKSLESTLLKRQEEALKQNDVLSATTPRISQEGQYKYESNKRQTCWGVPQVDCHHHDDYPEQLFQIPKILNPLPLNNNNYNTAVHRLLKTSQENRAMAPSLLSTQKPIATTQQHSLNSTSFLSTSTSDDNAVNLAPLSLQAFLSELQRMGQQQQQQKQDLQPARFQLQPNSTLPARSRVTPSVQVALLASILSGSAGFL